MKDPIAPVRALREQLAAEIAARQAELAGVELAIRLLEERTPQPELLALPAPGAVDAAGSAPARKPKAALAAKPAPAGLPDDEIARLRELWPRADLTNAAIAAALKRSVATIARRGARLGLPPRPKGRKKMEVGERRADPPIARRPIGKWWRAQKTKQRTEARGRP